MTVSTANPSGPLYNVVVTANGPGGFTRTLTTRRRGGRAIANFGRVRPGDYSILVGGGIGGQGVVLAQETTEITVRLAVPTIVADNPKIVLVKKRYQDGTGGLNPHRLRVQLGASSNFGGRGSLTCNHANHVRVYDAAIGGNHIPLPYDIPGAQLAAGKTVYVEGAQPSVRMNNTRLTLALQGGTPPGWGTAREDITCVELKLDICKWRTSRRAYPTPFTEQEKMNPGRYVSLYDGQGSTERAMMILHKARPHNFNGTLSLIPQDNRVQVFEAEQGGAALGNPYGVANGSVPASGKRLWIQGTNVSGGLRDTGFRVELQGLAGKEGDRIRATVVRLRMDSCKARTAAAVAPVPFSNNDKINIGRFIHKQNASNQHERGKLIIQRVQPNAFNGTLVLNMVEPRRGNLMNKAQLFDNENAAAPAGQVAHPNPYEFNHSGAFPAAGRAFWLEGRNESRRSRDTEVWLGIKDHIKKGDRVPVTVVKAFLDIYKNRTHRNRDPRAMTPQDKINVGRYIHVQMGNHHGRALAVTRRLKPNDANCTLVLKVCDAAGNASGRAQLFNDEVAAAGQAAHPNPFEIAHSAAFPAAGRRLWVQGNSVSGAIRDTEMWLGIKDHITKYDRVSLTVVRFSNLRADVSVTPENTNRLPTIANSPVNRHNFPHPAHALSANDFDVDFANNVPVVLIENSMPGANPVNLRVDVAPANVPVSWQMQRDRRAGNGDHARVISLPGNREVPTLTRNATGATLQANAVGSFHICPYVDCSGNNRFDFNDRSGRRIDREPFIMMNLVLVRVQGHRNRSRAQPGNIVVNNPAAGLMNLTVSTGGFANGPGAGMHCQARVDVIGGGQNGRRGLNQVFAGWVNNVTWAQVRMDYQDPATPGAAGAHSQSLIFASNNPRFANPAAGLGVFAPAAIAGWATSAAAPNILAAPVLDVSPFGAGNEGVGGNTAVGTEGAPGPPAAITKPNRAIGQRWHIQMWDSPGIFCLRNHLVHPGNAIRFRFNLNFRCDLNFWTNVNSVQGATAHAANRLYATVQTNTWRIRHDVSFNPATGIISATAQAATITRTKDPNPRRRATPVEGSGLEVRHPIALRLYSMDARN